MSAAGRGRLVAVDRDPVKVVRLAGGRAGAADVAFSGRRRLERALAEGRLVRARRGTYALPRLPDALALAAGLGGVVSHASAAALHGVGLVQPPDLVDVTVLRGSRPRRHAGVRLHWARSLGDGEVVKGMTAPVRTVLDCATTLPFREALAVADGMLARSYLRADELGAAARASAGAGRAARLRVATAADARADNPFESALRALVLEAGLGAFVPQLAIRLGRRLVHVDLGDPERRVVLEADSFEHHGTRAALVRDCERYNDLVAAGWTVLRFPWEHVMLRPAAVTRVLLETCARVDAVHGRTGGRRRTQPRTNSSTRGL